MPQLFQDLICRIRRVKDIPQLQEVAEDCHNAYLDKKFAGETYFCLCRMIVERFIYLNVPV